MKEFNLFLALEKLDLELTITEINSELERLLDLKQLINIYTEPKIILPPIENNSTYSPISILLGNQEYSTEQFILDCIKLFGYNDNSESTGQQKVKDKAIQKLTDTALDIKQDMTYKLSNEYNEDRHFKDGEILPIGYITLVNTTHSLIQNMFLLKAHFLKYQTKTQFMEPGTFQFNKLIIEFLGDYRKFVKSRLEELKKILKQTEEMEIES